VRLSPEDRFGGHGIWGRCCRAGPDHLRDGSPSLDFFVSLLLMPLSMALAGPAGSLFGVAAVFLVAASAVVVRCWWSGSDASRPTRSTQLDQEAGRLEPDHRGSLSSTPAIGVRRPAPAGPGVQRDRGMAVLGDVEGQSGRRRGDGDAMARSCRPSHTGPFRVHEHRSTSTPSPSAVSASVARDLVSTVHPASRVRPAG